MGPAVWGLDMSSGGLILGEAWERREEAVSPMAASPNRFIHIVRLCSLSAANTKLAQSLYIRKELKQVN